MPRATPTGKFAEVGASGADGTHRVNATAESDTARPEPEALSDCEAGVRVRDCRPIPQLSREAVGRQ